MRKEVKQYFDIVTDVYSKIVNNNPQLEDAAQAIADSIARGQLIHVIGTGGHSNMAAEELLWRAGGLAPVNAVLDASTNLIHGAKRSNIMERTTGLAERIFDSYRLGSTPKEVIIIANAYGINALTIEAVEEAHKRGMKVIAITSTGFANNVPNGAKARHPSNKNLYQIADYFINTFMPYGDAVVDIDNCVQKTAPTSTLCNTFAINMLMLSAVAKLSEMGIEPPLWMSANLPGGDEKNKVLEDKYFPLVKHLL